MITEQRGGLMASTSSKPAASVLLPRAFSARRRAALKAVLARANASKLKPASLGPFSAAPARYLLSSLHEPQIRAAAGPELGGAEFRHPFGPQSPQAVRQPRYADALLRCANAFVVAAKSGGLAEPLREAHDLARRVPTDANSHSSAMRVAAVGMSCMPSTDQVRLTLDIEMLGDDLQPSIERVYGWSHEAPDLEVQIDRKVARHAELCRRRAELAAGAVGWIDEIALRIAEEAAMTVAEVIHLLTENPELKLCHRGPATRPLSCSIRWKGGVLSGRAGDERSDFECLQKRLWVYGLILPETLKCGMPGKRLSAVFDHPLIPAEAIITGWDDFPRGARVPLRTGIALVLAEGVVARRADGAVRWIFDDL